MSARKRRGVRLALRCRRDAGHRGLHGPRDRMPDRAYLALAATDVMSALAESIPVPRADPRAGLLHPSVHPVSRGRSNRRRRAQDAEARPILSKELEACTLGVDDVRGLVVDCEQATGALAPLRLRLSRRLRVERARRTTSASGHMSHWHLASCPIENLALPENARRRSKGRP